MMRKITAMLLCAVGIAGCVSTPTQEVALPALEQLEVRRFSDGSTIFDGRQWVARFQDATLTRLVDEALDNNPTIAEAVANYDASRALLRSAGSALGPSLDVSLGESDSGIVDGSGDSVRTVGAALSWEADIWGRLRSARNAAAEEAEASAADLLFAERSLAAQTARAYFLLKEAIQQRELAERTAESLARSAELIRVRADAGFSDRGDLELILSDLANARSIVESAGLAERDAARSLEQLLGRFPSADIEASGDLPQPPAAPATGLPSDLLERRPDVLAAERRLAATLNRTREAQVARLPQLSLTGELSGASSSLSDAADPSNLIWNAVANLVLPVIDSGRRRAEAALRTAEQEAAAARYANVVLGAFQEVEGALDARAATDRQLDQLVTARDRAREAYRLTNTQYESGLIDLISTLEIERRLFNAASAAILAQRQLLDEQVTLYLALGGSY